MIMAPNDTLTLHRLRKIEIIVHAEDQRPVEDLLRAAGIGGWTMIRDVAGLGHGGFHQGRSIFNDQTGLVMFVGVGEAAAIERAARGLARLFETRPGVTFLSEVEVMRSDYFAPGPADRATPAERN
jgi:nitrogen regulatory protein PII